MCHILRSEGPRLWKQIVKSEAASRKQGTGQGEVLRWWCGLVPCMSFRKESQDAQLRRTQYMPGAGTYWNIVSACFSIVFLFAQSRTKKLIIRGCFRMRLCCFCGRSFSVKAVQSRAEGTWCGDGLCAFFIVAGLIARTLTRKHGVLLLGHPATDILKHAMWFGPFKVCF